jgi:hypothetical protein
MENNYSYQFKDSDELGDVIWNYKDICSKNSLNNIWEGFKVADEYIIKNYGEPEKWDTSNVTKMNYLFYEIYEPIDFSKYDLSNWNTSNVLSMKGMFKEGDIWFDITKWNVSKVEDMSCMFYDAEFYDIKLDFSKWNINKVKDMSYMFYGAYFNIKLDLSSWDIKNIKNTKDIFKKSKNKDFITF